MRRYSIRITPRTAVISTAAKAERIRNTRCYSRICAQEHGEFVVLLQGVRNEQSHGRARADRCSLPRSDAGSRYGDEWDASQENLEQQRWQIFSAHRWVGRDSERAHLHRNGTSRIATCVEGYICGRHALQVIRMVFKMIREDEAMTDASSSRLPSE